MNTIRKIVTAGVATLALGGMTATTAATTASASSSSTIAAGPASYSHKTVAYGPWWLSNGMARLHGAVQDALVRGQGAAIRPGHCSSVPPKPLDLLLQVFSSRSGTIYVWDTNGQRLSSASIHFYRAVHSPTSWGWYFTRIQLSADHGHITQSWYWDWDWHQPPGFWWILSHQTGDGF
jgi:hypothetical protein